jgi:hypothetical protein
VLSNDIDTETGLPKKIDMISKTAQLDKNANFGRYLDEEHRIMAKLNGVEGVVQSHGFQQVKNPFNNNKLENHVVLEYMQYGSLHALSIFTKPYDEPAAYVVIR